MKSVLAYISLAAALAVLPASLDFNSLSEAQKIAASQGQLVYNSGAYSLWYVNATQGNEEFEGQRAVVYLPEEQKHFVFDLFSGNQLFPIDRPAPTAILTASGANAVAKALSIFEKQCINQEIGNPESGICLYHSCSYGDSKNCSGEYFDCCTASLQDYNGRYMCSNAICKKTSEIWTNYKNGGCCSSSGDSISPPI